MPDTIPPAETDSRVTADKISRERVGIAFTLGEVSTYYAARVPRLKQGRLAHWRGPCPIHCGRNDNFAVDPGTGRWFCHSACGRGGDILALERELTGVGFRAAKAQVFGLLGRFDPEDGSSPEESRRLALRRSAVERAAREVWYWRRGRIVQLEQRKAAAIDTDDITALAELSTELHLLTTDGAIAVRLYHTHFRRDRLGAMELARWAREDERHSHGVAAAVVLMLARASGVLCRVMTP